tara:strand:+ start:1068 stop:1535 length:468 start_codon:yes stop_codon:yes gene_type:complete
MSFRGQAQYLRVYIPGGSDFQLWQNFYVNQSVTVSSKTYTYFPFACDGISETSALGGRSVKVECPATFQAVNTFEPAAKNMYLCQLEVFEFDTRLGVASPQSGQTLIASFIGYVVRMSGSFTALRVELGSTLAPIGAQIPPLTASNALVGVPIQT